MSYRTLVRDTWSRGVQTSGKAIEQRPYPGWRISTFLVKKGIPSSGKSTGQGLEGSKGQIIWKTVSRVHRAHQLEYRWAGRDETAHRFPACCLENTVGL